MNNTNEEAPFEFKSLLEEYYDLGNKKSNVNKEQKSTENSTNKTPEEICLVSNVRKPVINFHSKLEDYYWADGISGQREKYKEECNEIIINRPPENLTDWFKYFISERWIEEIGDFWVVVDKKNKVIDISKATSLWEYFIFSKNAITIFKNIKSLLSDKTDLDKCNWAKRNITNGCYKQILKILFEDNNYTVTG